MRQLRLFVFASVTALTACAHDAANRLRSSENTRQTNDDSILSLGQMIPTDQQSDFLLAAPHGSFDKGTDQVLRDICPRLKWNYLLVKGYRTIAHPINVNRPTEGVGISASEETETTRARRVYQLYQEQFDRLYRKESSRWYVELHGNINPCCDHALEIATVGADADAAEALRSALRDSLTIAGISAEDLDIRVEPINALRYMATGNKKKGVLRDANRALHIEAPSAMLNERRAQYTAALLDFFQKLSLGVL